MLPVPPPLVKTILFQKRGALAQQEMWSRGCREGAFHGQPCLISCHRFQGPGLRLPLQALT
jgi:hypothetical protein